ncbi:integrin alpha-3-like isoform X2 [Eleginops maclovinus]|uniref:integrin alpha-3-like isoform X2 n=1 Tax=Eleginops maclovinus TaxID=56733 RepID=UPI00308005CF
MATVVCVFLIVCVGVCVAFNVDTEFPVLKTGGEGSLFGLSVSLHQDLQTDRFLLLVGAPRERAEPNVPANRTGGVYSCPITADQSECSRMMLVDPETRLSEDLIEDMWLGVSVSSQGRQGGRVLVCGHRFVKLYGAFKLKHMIGRCYLRGNDLKYNHTDFTWQNPEQTCSHLGDVSGEVMCNMGISSFITQTEVIVGSPGSYEWQGNVHMSWINPDVVFDSKKISFPNLQRRNIYIGYSVTQARGLLSQEDETIVTGAPKDSREDARGSVLLVVKRSDELLSQQTLRGHQTGSFYGNAVATADINNDGWSDLLVGAPFYFQREPEVGGAVYVYLNTGGGLDPEPSTVLTGPGGSGFGMSVTSAGDLDQDGFTDFAVGAPFHGTGSVMIFSGSRGGVSSEPRQVIQGSSVSPGFRTFGYSLSGGQDVDGNRYPDLLVGSLDDQVALLRTRPVIYLNKTIRVSPDVVDPNNCDICIQVEVCFSYMFSTGERSHRDNITVLFTVSGDVTSIKPRLQFIGSDQSVSGFLLMPSQRCVQLRAGLQSPVRNKVEPLVFSLNASLHEKLPRKRNSVQDLKHLPVLSQTPRPIRTQIHIQKACGSDNRCNSNLQMTAQFTDQNQNPFTRQQDSQVLVYDSRVSRLFLEVNVSNAASALRPAEDAHNAALNISVPTTLSYSGVRAKVQVWIIFQPSEISLNTREIQTVLQLSTLSEQDDLLPVCVSMLVRFSLQTSLSLVTPPGPASFGGHVIGESAMRRTQDVGSLLLFILQVRVTGKPLGHLGNLQVEFDWPREVSNGKWLLYLEEIRLDGTSEVHCDPPGNIVNPLNLKLEEEEDRGRRRRSLLDQRGRSLLKGNRKSYSLDCVHGARCVAFVCPLLNMSSSASLTVRARLWSSTLMEDFRDAHSLLVRFWATLKLQSNKSTLIMEPRSSQIEVHIYPTAGQQLDSGAPLWILVVSVLAGVSLLAVICLLLWKVGFFMRRRAWRVALHQGRILGKDEQHTDADGFLIRDGNRKLAKHWVTSWSETH